MHPPARVLGDFEGLWHLDRDVMHRSGERARMSGRAEFAADGDGLRYREEGRMRMEGGPTLTTARTYLWRPALEVWFEDGRFFHSVPPTGGVATHWCDPDSYEVVYDFDLWPEWSTRWTVRGPRKDYEMLTRYRPFTTPR